MPIDYKPTRVHMDERSTCSLSNHVPGVCQKNSTHRAPAGELAAGKNRLKKGAGQEPSLFRLGLETQRRTTLRPHHSRRPAQLSGLGDGRRFQGRKPTKKHSSKRLHTEVILFARGLRTRTCGILQPNPRT